MVHRRGVRRRDDGQAVRPPVDLAELLHLVKGAGINHFVIRPLSVRGVAGRFLLRDGLRQGRNDLRPDDFPGIAAQLLLRVGGEGPGIFRRPQHGNAPVDPGGADLGDEGGRADRDSGNTDVFGRDGGPGFLGGAQAAAAVARDHRVDLKLLEALLKGNGLRALAEDGIGARVSDLLKPIDFGGRIFGQDAVFELLVRHRSHEAAAHQGDLLSRQGIQPRRLLDALHGVVAHRRHDGVHRLIVLIDGGNGAEILPAVLGRGGGKGPSRPAQRQRQDQQRQNPSFSCGHGRKTSLKKSFLHHFKRSGGRKSSFIFYMSQY